MSRSNGAAPSITFEDVRIAYHTRGATAMPIVENLTMQLVPRSLLCVAGRSGSGKTSILRVAAGLTPPTAGVVRWWGDDVAELSAPNVADMRRRRIGYADQSGSMIPDLSVLENVLIPALPDGRRDVRAKRDQAVRLLKALGLGDRLAHRAPALSGGERQRVVLARSLIMQPEVLITDEPTAGLDRARADDVIAMLAAHAAAGGAVLVASHDPHVVGAASDLIELEDNTLLALTGGRPASPAG